MDKSRRCDNYLVDQVVIKRSGCRGDETQDRTPSFVAASSSRTESRTLFGAPVLLLLRTITLYSPVDPQPCKVSLVLYS